jgi:Domain of unknown function (DUF4349)
MVAFIHRVSLLVLVLSLVGCETQGEIGTNDAVQLNTTAPDQNLPVATIPGNMASAESTEKPLTLPAEPDRPATLARRMIYMGEMNLLAFNINSVLEQVRATATSLGGYMSALEGRSITVRVPVAKFDDLVSSVSKMGEVISKQIKAADVTEELLDLNIRLENAEKSRQRLLDHLKDSNKMEDTIKIEAELQRVTEAIELMKGRLRYLGDQVAYSTLRVTVNSPLPQHNEQLQIPFAWVRDIGAGLASGSVESAPMRGGLFDHGAKFELPKTYIRYFDSETLTQAMNASGVFIKLQQIPNYDKGDASLWADFAKRILKEQRSVNITQETTLTLANGDVAQMIRGEHNVGQRQSYVLAILSHEKQIYVFEAWGPSEAFDPDWPAIQRAIQTLHTK